MIFFQILSYNIERGIRVLRLKTRRFQKVIFPQVKILTTVLFVSAQDQKFKKQKSSKKGLFLQNRKVEQR